VLADKSRTKRPRNTKNGRKVGHPTGYKVHQFQGQRSRSPDRSTTMASYKGLCSSVIARGWEHTMLAAPVTVAQLVIIILLIIIIIIIICLLLLPTPTTSVGVGRI